MRNASYIANTVYLLYNTQHMNRGFWERLPKPFFILAPMYDVTDFAFRQVICQTGKPDVFFTEFVSTDGLCSQKGYPKLLHHLKFGENERPIVAQVFGARPEKFTQTAQLLQELGFDGIDINMGCPDKNIIKGGSCAALYKTPELAREIIEATKAGAGSLPVSVKIRIGDTKIDWQNWIGTLLKAEPSAISIHLRTRKEMSAVPAHWEELPKIVNFIQEQTSLENRPLIIGNGDVLTLDDARLKIADSGCDGLMIGRGIFHNPWLFKRSGSPSAPPSVIPSSATASAGRPEATNESTSAGYPESISSQPSTKAYEPKMADKQDTKSRIRLMLTHAVLFEANFTGIKKFEVFKRFIKIYINGFEGSSDLREQLYKCENVEQLKKCISHLI